MAGTQSVLHSWYTSLRIYMRNAMGRKFEPEVAYLKDIVKPGDICLHIGASDGRHSYVLSPLVAPGGAIYCFEPSSDSFAVLTRLIGWHGLGNVQCYHKAVADKQGSVVLTSPIKRNGRLGRAFASIGAIGKVPQMKYVNETVETISIDEFCRTQNLPRVDFVRCDVEGAEILVCAGGKQTFAQSLPYVLMELHPVALRDNFNSDVNKVCDFFTQLGYRMFCLENDTVVEKKEAVFENWRDYFFIHPSRIAALPLDSHFKKFF